MRKPPFRRVVPLLILAFSTAGQAADISVVGLFPGKAVLVVDGGAPRTYSAGAKVGPDAKLIAVDDESATFDIDGKRERIAIGGHAGRAKTVRGTATAILNADDRGHFMVDGQINGGSMRMMVDTGATMIALSADDALRLGIDYRKGQVGMVNTANGVAKVYRVKLDSVRVGEIELHQVDAAVQENGLPFALLGMSFLNRTTMQRDGERMTLVKRF